MTFTYAPVNFTYAPVNFTYAPVNFICMNYGLVCYFPDVFLFGKFIVISCLVCDIFLLFYNANDSELCLLINYTFSNVCAKFQSSRLLFRC